VQDKNFLSSSEHSSHPVLAKVLDGLLFVLTLAAVLFPFWDGHEEWMLVTTLSLFVACFAARFFLARDRNAYLRANWLDLVLVVVLSSPLLRLFAALRIFKFATMLRVLRLGGILHMNRRRLFRLLIISKNNFPAMMTLVFMMVFIFGLLEYLVEHPTNPAFGTIEDALWWAFVTLTTVGYGDLYPTSSIGRIVAVFTMLFGITMYSLLVANLTYQLERIGEIMKAEETEKNQSTIQDPLTPPPEPKQDP